MKYLKSFVIILSIFQLQFIKAQNLSFSDMAIPLWIFYGDNPSGSICWGDYDNDNDIDLYVVKTGYAVTGPQVVNYLFRNDVNTDGRFYEVAAQLGIDEEFSNSWAATWCDVNNDGWLDLYICNLSDIISPIENKLLINNGTTFDDLTNTYLVSNHGSNRACCWGDYDNDGDQNLFLTLTFAAGYQESKLYRNDGSVFVDVTHIYNITTPSLYSSPFSHWVDFDNDNDLDLYINTSQVDSKFYENKINENNSFVDISNTYAINDSGNSFGSIWFDYDNDADLDLFLIGAENRLYRNDISQINDFTDVTLPLGFTSNLSLGNATTGDFDLDGDIDLYFIKSQSPNKYYRNDINDSGIFIEEGIQLNIADTLSGLATTGIDYDNDGDLDIFVLNNGDGLYNRMYRNELNTDNYLLIRLTDINGSYNRFGSKVKIYFAGSDSLAGMRVVDGGGNGGNNQGQYDCHFGLDENLSYDIEVIFTTRTNGQNHIFNKHNRSELGNYIPSQSGHFLEVRDSVVTVTSITPKENPQIITNFKLYQNYPNPFNSTTVIPFQLDKTYNVKLIIYDLTGKEVKTLKNGQFSKGNYTSQWDGKNNKNIETSSGVYTFVLILDNQPRAARKIILLR